MKKLPEKNKKFAMRRVLELPWIFWSIVVFLLFETITVIVYTQNVTEPAKQRFNVDSVAAGWYTATLQYVGLFLVPCIGVCADIFGNRICVRSVVS